MFFSAVPVLLHLSRQKRPNLNLISFPLREPSNFIYHFTLVFPLKFSFLNIFLEVFQIIKATRTVLPTKQHNTVVIHHSEVIDIQSRVGFFLLYSLLTPNF